MNDWWVWHTTDLVNWQRVSVLKPEETYFKHASTECWRPMRRAAMAGITFTSPWGDENIGVVERKGPAGPWRDPLGHPLIAKGDVNTHFRDPGISQEADGTANIVFGANYYYIARLKEDMISLDETPWLIHIENPEVHTERDRPMTSRFFISAEISTISPGVATMRSPNPCMVPTSAKVRLSVRTGWLRDISIRRIGRGRMQRRQNGEQSIRPLCWNV